MRAIAATSTTTCIAPAKVNLCLRIVGRRSDGYHLLDSIFAAIDLCDRLTITGCCQGDGYRVGFGEVSGRILPAA